MGRRKRSIWASAFLVLTAMRPTQWTKNVVVLAALAFGYGDRGQQLRLLPGLCRVLPAVVLFCLASSGVYLVNDLLDRSRDQAHPTKRHRPIASGRLDPRLALVASVLLLALALSGSALLSVSFFKVILAYIALQVMYSLFFRRIALLDVFVIASGFVLRAIGGAAVFENPPVPISPWLLLCTFLLAMLLALCKRRQEKGALERVAGSRQRTSLQKYDLQLLDQLIAAVSAAVVVAYSIYTFWPDTVSKFGTTKLGFTIPVVMFGVFRYLDLLYRQDKGDRPDRLLLSDMPLLMTVLIYGLVVMLVFAMRPVVA